MRPMIMSVLYLLLLFVGLATATVSSAGLETRLINGDLATYTEFPWMVSLRITTSKSHTCGAAIITPDHVITAAHCVADDVPNPISPDTRFVVTGQLSNIAGGRATDVVRVRIHPEYDPSATWRNDIAVLKLATPISFNALELPIPIASADVGVQPCILSGWGRTYTPASGLPSRLQKQILKTMTKETCMETWGNSSIYDSTLCAGGVLGEGICSGDSGGPLVCNGELAGIVSWGNLCANGLPDGFTRVFYYRDWILENIADVTPQENRAVLAD